MFPPHLPKCIISIKSGIEHWVQWKLWKANTGHIMANTSDGEIIDWSPKGDPLDKNNNLDLPILLNNTLDFMNNIVNSSIYWHGGSLSPSLPQLPYLPLHSELLKISAAFQLITAWKGQFNSTVSGHSLHFDKNSTHLIKACVCLPFILFIGPTFYNASSGLLVKIVPFTLVLILLFNFRMAILYIF